MMYYTLAGKPIQHMYRIELQRGDSVEVVFHSTIHVNKEVRCSMSWSTDFTDSEILHDKALSRWIYQRWGNILAPVQPGMPGVDYD